MPKLILHQDLRHCIIHWRKPASHNWLFSVKLRNIRIFTGIMYGQRAIRRSFFPISSGIYFNKRACSVKRAHVGKSPWAEPLLIRIYNIRWRFYATIHDPNCVAIPFRISPDLETRRGAMFNLVAMFSQEESRVNLACFERIVMGCIVHQFEIIY